MIGFHGNSCALQVNVYLRPGVHDFDELRLLGVVCDDGQCLDQVRHGNDKVTLEPQFNDVLKLSFSSIVNQFKKNTTLNIMSGTSD